MEDGAMGQANGRLVVGVAAPAATPAAARLAWVDNLKIAVIAGVVVVHAAITYVIDVDWYYQERTTSGLWQALLSLPMLGAPFVLGPLFLLGGVFAAASLARRGPGGFGHSRLLRLGVPLVVFVAVLSPLTNYLGDLGEGRRPSVWPYLAPGGPEQDSGPLWFVAALLSFSLVYAAWRWSRPAGSHRGAAVRPRQLLIAAAVIAAGSVAVRLRWPYDTSDAFLDLRWAEWPQGAVLFTLGVLWGERGWRGRVPVAWSHRCGQVAAAGLAALSLLAVVTVMAEEDLDRLFGGWHWQSLAFAVLEGVVAVALSLWLVVWFRRRWAHQGRLAKRASRGAYAAYVLHAPVLVLVSLAARPLPLPPEAKFVLVAAAGVVAAFTVGWAVTRSALVARFV
jgi:glucan biosynthesis protein C